ncbi:flavin reductase domain protein FMN-binding protein [Pantoea sp. At-9b]|nr:flavin reductase domain protein FMN-binding protein [Pantoea sp. At-9b]
MIAKFQSSFIAESRMSEFLMSVTSSHQESISLDDFRHGMRRLASGVSLVTTQHAGEKYGLIASSVSSLTAEPPSLLVCVNQSATSHAYFLQAGHFAVNVLREQHADLCAQFSQSSRREERFQTGNWQTITTGAPVLADALVSFDCQLEKVVEWHTHSVLLARIVGINLAGEAAEPMVYFNSGFHALSL